MKASRGAAVPETTVVLGLVLTLLFGTCELGVIGLSQLGGDGAAYVAAHASVLGKDPNAAIADPFPLVAQNASVDVRSSQPDSTTVDVDYNVAAQTSRHGGASVVRPAHSQVTVSNDAVGLGMILPKTPISSAAIEPNMMVSGVGFNLFGDPLNSAADFGHTKSYFTDDGNVPPYSVGFRFLYHCAPSTGVGCTSNGTLYAAGFGAHLDGSNWSKAQNGVGPGGVYEALSIHQQVYANIAQQLNGKTAATAAPVLASTTRCMQTVNNWDTSIGSSVQAGGVALGTFPLAPLANTPGCP